MIPALETYSEEQTEKLKLFSDAFRRYFRLKSHSPANFEESLRIQRIKSWCEVSLATFYHPQLTEKACFAWSQTADRILIECFHHFSLGSEDLSLFALGKLGAQELNLSSDVDLIFVTESQPSEAALKKVRQFTKALSTTSFLGHCFRVDLDLRPGGSSSPVITSFSQFQDHYWNQAELWERLALVRLRPICGDAVLTASITKLRDQFCFRRYVDLSLFDELKKLRPKIHAVGQGDKKNILNLKLSPGMIRDIELFINANQILLAGKFPSLKTTSTTEACDILVQNSSQAALFTRIKELYWTYRQLENQVQAVNDAHTHDLNFAVPPAGWVWPKQAEIQAHSRFVDDHISQLLGKRETTTGHLKHSLDDIHVRDLEKMGFQSTSMETWERIKTLSLPLRKQKSDEDARVQVIQLFLQELSKTKFDADLGLKGLADFLSSAKAKTTLFQLLAQEPRLIQDMSYLFSLSPYLGSFFSSRPELIDAFFLNVDETLSEDMESALMQMSERKKLSEIRAALTFLKNFDITNLTTTLTSVADQITSHLIKIVAAEYGAPNMDVVALGKWGGGELGFRSDLDFIFITEGAIEEVHHKVARRFVSRLRDHSFGGPIYQVDLRLRPDGKGGSLITTREQIGEFLHHSASAWERQAYLKARFVKDNKNGLDLHDWTKPLSATDLEELKDIRKKLLRSAPENSVLIKYNAGGLIDVELGVQGALLDQKIKPPGARTEDFFEALPHKELTNLRTNYRFLRTLEQLGRILSNSAGDEFDFQGAKFKLCAQVLESNPSDLREKIESCLAHNQEILKGLDPIHLK